MIIDTFEESGVAIERLYACGGISQKNPFLMQVYADVLKREIHIARSTQTPALGSAMFGAVAAGKAAGGYDTIEDASKEMGGTLPTVYRPCPKNSAMYEKLYAEYRRHEAPEGNPQRTDAGINFRGPSRQGTAPEFYRG